MELFFLTAGAGATIVSMLVTAMVIKYGKRWRIIDDPSRHLHPKVVHSEPVPRGGAVPVLAAVGGGMLLFAQVDISVLGILAGAGILTIIGVLDDRFEEAISPYLRLAVNALAAGLVIFSGTYVGYVTSPWGGVLELRELEMCTWVGCAPIVAMLVTALWLMWMQNMVGWSSGVDGQLPGFVIVAAVVMGILGLRLDDPSQFAVILMAALTAGAYLGFLVFNWWPQKIMPGYGGKSLAGFFLGIMAIISGAKVGTLMMVLSVPAIDAVWVIVKRIREGRSPVWGGREHFHHYLLAMGWSKQAIAVFYTTVSIFFGIIAVLLQASSKYFTIALISLAVSAVIVWLHYFSTYLRQPDHGNG